MIVDCGDTWQSQAGGRSQKGQGKVTVLQIMNEWDEWGQSDEYSSVPILSII